MSLHRANSLVIDEYVGMSVDETLFQNIQGRKETLGNPSDDEIKAVLQARRQYTLLIDLSPRALLRKQS